MSDVFLTAAVRTPVGSFGGVFKDVRASELTVSVLNALIERGRLQKKDIDAIILGECHQQIDECNTARVAAMLAGFPKEVDGITINRVCTSGLQAIVMGTQAIKTRDAEVVIAGGVESMSSAPYILRTARWGQRLRHGEMRDAIWEGFTCKACGLIMGKTAENLVEEYSITRENQDEIAFRSQKLAGQAMESKFSDEITSVEVAGKKGSKTVVERDEYPRPDITMEDLAKLKPVFKEDGTVTAGNSSGINDGAAGVILMSERKMKESGATPLARIVGYAMASVEPELMGYGPVQAVKKVLKRTGLSLGEIGLIELNEAFAAQYLVCEKLLDLDREIVNVNGSGIALGHPVGCTGARITVTLVHEMIRRNARTGLSTLCGMGGVSTALILEKC